jgi:hypothetical protein
VLSNLLYKPCARFGRKVDRSWCRQKNGVLHKRYLWIYIHFSTNGLAKAGNFKLNTAACPVQRRPLQDLAGQVGAGGCASGDVERSPWPVETTAHSATLFFSVSLASIVVVNKFVYKLVVIVNAHEIVDKCFFLHSINSLRRLQVAGKGLFLDCKKIGQNMRRPLKRRFCTFVPVDIPNVFHRDSELKRAAAAGEPGLG